jgi:hypothetical protein
MAAAAAVTGNSTWRRRQGKKTVEEVSVADVQ